MLGVELGTHRCLLGFVNVVYLAALLRLKAADVLRVLSPRFVAGAAEEGDGAVRSYLDSLYHRRSSKWGQ